MKIKLNGREENILKKISLMELIRQEKTPTAGLVAMVNDEVIPSALWEKRHLSPEDEIELLSFVSGG